MPADAARDCVVPTGFITEFADRSDPDDDTDERATRASRTSMAEARQLKFSLVANSNLEALFDSQARTYRLNRGEWKDGVWTGFDAVLGDMDLKVAGKRVFVNDVWVDQAALSTNGRRKFRVDAAAPRREKFFLAAHKVTDSLLFTPHAVPEGLSLVNRDASGGDGSYPTRLGFRSGAISACFLLVQAAATELDVDPDEFEVLEPRVWSARNADRRPLLQICDFHVNGAGFCDRLSVPVRGGEPLFLDLMKRILTKRAEAPLKDLVAREHREKCDQACYGCLCRFGNQPYHGLLDWRLGLDVLSLLVFQNYQAGLDGNYNFAGIDDWRDLAERYASEAKRLFPGCNRQQIRDIEMVELRPRVWMAILHPFWDWNYLLSNSLELSSFVQRAREVVPVNTFDLARRFVGTVERARSSGS